MRVTRANRLFSATGRSLAAASFALAWFSVPAQAQSIHAVVAAPATGALLGEVRDPSGVVQMGAAVFLYDRYDNFLQRAVSNENGRFAFADLPPEIYTLRVTLASFLPALRRNITILPGAEKLLQVSLSTVLSSIEVAPGMPGKVTLMSDEWKWVLRSSQSTRPVLRVLPHESPADSETATSFSDVTGVVRLSSGDSNLLNSGLQQDMGTAFAVETSVARDTKVRVSGSLGYNAASGLPSAGIRTSYMRNRNGAPGPRVSLTVRQAYLSSGIANGEQNGPTLRSASLSSIDSIEILDALRLEYGSSLDSITLYGRMNYISPFARASYNLGAGGMIRVAYSSGFTPTELLTYGPEGQTDFTSDLAALGQAPRISRSDGNATVERTRNYEASYEIADGKRRLIASGFREEVSNAVFLMSGSLSLAGADNLLPDLNSRGTVVNGGNFQRTGVSLALMQELNDFLQIAIAGGRAGALSSDGDAVEPGSIRLHIRQVQSPWVTVRMDASVPVTGTRFATSYGWTDYNTLMPVHQSLTGRSLQQVGWNISTVQPLPAMFGMRMEVMAEIRNLLAQGYLTMHDSEGYKASITNTPRQVRGGLTFIF